MRSALLKDRDARRVVFQIKRALCGHITFLGACRVEKAFSEYVLYEPILRVLLAHGYQVECEYAHGSFPREKRGDAKKLDFYATGSSAAIALEVKWASKSSALNVNRDFEKLSQVAKADQHCIPLLCVFGRKRFISKSRLKLRPNAFKEWGKPVYVDRKPMYGCRFFRLSKSEA